MPKVQPRRFKERQFLHCVKKDILQNLVKNYIMQLQDNCCDPIYAKNNLED